MTLAWAARSPRSYLERGRSRCYSVLSSRQPSAGNLIAAIPLGVGQMPNEAACWSNRVTPEDASGFPRGGRACRRILHAEAGSEESADHRDIRRGRLEGLWFEAQDDVVDTLHPLSEEFAT
jgi:hypothetical protein